MRVSKYLLAGLFLINGPIQLFSGSFWLGVVTIALGIAFLVLAIRERRAESARDGARPPERSARKPWHTYTAWGLLGGFVLGGVGWIAAPFGGYDERFPQAVVLVSFASLLVMTVYSAIRKRAKAGR
jgi:uncharacterized membrane protein YfcA